MMISMRRTISKCDVFDVCRFTFDGAEDFSCRRKFFGSLDTSMKSVFDEFDCVDADRIDITIEIFDCTRDIDKLCQ